MQRPKSYHKDFNLGLTDWEIRSLVTSIILQSVLLHAPDSFAAAGWQELGTGNRVAAVGTARPSGAGVAGGK